MLMSQRILQYYVIKLMQNLFILVLTMFSQVIILMHMMLIHQQDLYQYMVNQSWRGKEGLLMRLINTLLSEPHGPLESMDIILWIQC
ncbi:hypothetical protein D3C75_1065500 [compost metagenome]